MDLAEIKQWRDNVNSVPVSVFIASLDWLIAEVDRLTALCDGYRGEVAVLKAEEEKTRAYWSSAYYRMEAKCEELQSALTRARAEGMEDLACYMIDNCERDIITEEYLQNVLAACLKTSAAKGEHSEG